MDINQLNKLGHVLLDRVDETDRPESVASEGEKSGGSQLAGPRPVAPDAATVSQEPSSPDAEGGIEISELLWREKEREKLSGEISNLASSGSGNGAFEHLFRVLRAGKLSIDDLKAAVSDAEEQHGKESSILDSMKHVLSKYPDLLEAFQSIKVKGEDGKLVEMDPSVAKALTFAELKRAVAAEVAGSIQPEDIGEDYSEAGTIIEVTDGDSTNRYNIVENKEGDYVLVVHDPEAPSAKKVDDVAKYVRDKVIPNDDLMHFDIDSGVEQVVEDAIIAEIQKRDEIPTPGLIHRVLTAFARTGTVIEGHQIERNGRKFHIIPVQTMPTHSDQSIFASALGEQETIDRLGKDGAIATDQSFSFRTAYEGALAEIRARYQSLDGEIAAPQFLIGDKPKESAKVSFADILDFDEAGFLSKGAEIPDKFKYDEGHSPQLAVKYFFQQLGIKNGLRDEALSRFVDMNISQFPDGIRGKADFEKVLKGGDDYTKMLGNFKKTPGENYLAFLRQNKVPIDFRARQVAGQVKSWAQFDALVHASRSQPESSVAFSYLTMIGKKSPYQFDQNSFNGIAGDDQNMAPQVKLLVDALNKRGNQLYAAVDVAHHQYQEALQKLRAAATPAGQRSAESKLVKAREALARAGDKLHTWYDKTSEGIINNDTDVIEDGLPQGFDDVPDVVAAQLDKKAGNTSVTDSVRKVDGDVKFWLGMIPGLGTSLATLLGTQIPTEEQEAQAYGNMQFGVQQVVQTEDVQAGNIDSVGSDLKSAVADIGQGDQSAQSAQQRFDEAMKTGGGETLRQYAHGRSGGMAV